MKEVKTAWQKPNMLITIVLSLIMVVALGTFISRIMEYNDLKKEKEILQREIEACKEEIAALEYEYDSPMDDEYIESVAKDKLGLINPNEIVVVNEVIE
ncbi:MAG TPA: septum formation initiator family protein [Bacillota bacterium]|nr:septum formation initiator family protein [Bacillota bacterium]